MEKVSQSLYLKTHAKFGLCCLRQFIYMIIVKQISSENTEASYEIQTIFGCVELLEFFLINLHGLLFSNKCQAHLFLLVYFNTFLFLMNTHTHFSLYLPLRHFPI